jgi:hypothetical protein
MVAYINESPKILEIGTKEEFLLKIKMCATDNLVFLLKEVADSSTN